MKKNIIKEIFSYIVIILAVILFRTFLYSPIRVTGDSMIPTLYDGDIMILNKIGYRINGLNRLIRQIELIPNIIYFIAYKL